ncbi:ABC transporter substrate-binding protein [Burkholderia pyrrocinia]|nr:ABC transporter substrate-binding protein [Burkholderia pyrrocinia]
MTHARKALTRLLAVAMVALLPSTAALAEATVGKGVVKVGSDLTYPPYNYFAPGNKPAGFDVELMTALANALDMKAEFLDTRFENLIIGVRGSQFDVIASTLYVKAERAKQIDFIPYMRTGVSIAVAANSGFSPKKPEDLCGKKVGSIKGAAWIEKLNALANGPCKGNPIDSREFPTSPEATQALLSGGVDAQMEDSAVLQNAVSKLSGRVKISSNENFYPVIVGLGLRKGNKELNAAIRKGLRTLQQNGFYDGLLKKYNVSRPTMAEYEAAIGQPQN